MSPIPELGNSYNLIKNGTVEKQNGAFVLNGRSYLKTNPNNLYINDSLAVDSWFKPNNIQSQLPLFDVDLSYIFTVGWLEFYIEQRLNVIYDRNKQEFQVNIVAKDIANHEISNEYNLIAALSAVLANTIPEQKFKITITENITLTESLPSLVGSEFQGGGNTLARGTELTIESNSTTSPKFISGNNLVQILAIDADDCIINLRNLELREGKAQGSSGEPGGGSGLGAGGALFIAGGTVNIEGVRFINNWAYGGTALETEVNHGQGGNAVHVNNESLLSPPGKNGGQGGAFNITGNPDYYGSVAIFGRGGEAGKGAFGNQGGPEGKTNPGAAGEKGSFGCGGGQGGGGQGGYRERGNKNDAGGDGGSGGSGGFGAGGGGGGGGGGQYKVATEWAIGGPIGDAGQYGSVGISGESCAAHQETPSGRQGGKGGNGAGLGGAIFVPDSSNLTGISRQPRVTISASCYFEGNGVQSGGSGAQAKGKAIFFESERWVYNNSGEGDGFPAEGIIADITEHRVQTLEELVTAIHEANQSEVDNVIILKNDITLQDTTFGPLSGKNLLIQNTDSGSGKSSGGLIIRSEEGQHYSISGQNQFQIISMDNFGGYLELYNLELKDGLAQGGNSEHGGGGGLGAGGALFVNSGNVVVDSVTFTNNKAFGGNGGGEGSKAGNGEPATAAGSGGHCNTSGLLSLDNGSGRGGSASSSNKRDGENGSHGNWGIGGGAGSAPQYRTLSSTKNYYAGHGGFGGFGAGGGAGASNATVCFRPDHVNQYICQKGNRGNGRAGGQYGKPGTNASPSQEDACTIGTPGVGGAGAGLGGAIFVRNASSSGSGVNDTFVSIKNSRFSGNEVQGGVGNGNGEAKGKAIFTESMGDNSIDDPTNNQPIDYRSDVGLLSPNPEKQALYATSRYSVTVPVESVTYTYASDDFTCNWHHIATSFSNGGVPQVFLDGIPLPRTDENKGIEINQDRGFHPSTESVLYWGYVKNLGSSFIGEVNGLRFFDRSLSSSEIFDAASEAIQRLIIQLDESRDAIESAKVLYQFPTSAPFNTTWIKLLRGNNEPTQVNNPTSSNWSEIKATLGDGVVIELVGSGNGNTVGYTDQTTLSGYTPDELVAALKQILPGGLSAAEMFISATNFVDPNGYETAELSDEKELTDETEPATLRFSKALMEADLTESVNYGPLKRFNENNDIEFKQTTDIWVLYEQVNAENPVILDYTHKPFDVASIISIGIKIYSLVNKGKDIYKEAKSINKVIDSEVETSLSTFRQLDFDSITEDTSVKANKPDSLETAKARRKTSKFYDIFRIDTAKAMKVFLKDADLLTTGMSLSNVGLQLATPDLVGAISGSGASVADHLNKPSNKGSILFKNNKNKKFRTKLLKATKCGFKNGAFTIVTGYSTVSGAVQLFKTGNTYDIVKGSLQIASGLVLPIVEVTTEALIVAEFTSSTAAGPFGLVVAAVSLVIDIGLMIADAIRKAIQRQKLARKASQFAADGFYDLITDLKGSLDNIDDLYISGAFSNLPLESKTIVLTGITSWLYQALSSSLRNGESIDSILGKNPDSKNLSVDEFIDELVNNKLNIDSETANVFHGIYDLWTKQEEGLHPVIDIDLVSDSTKTFNDHNLIDSLKQFLGERLDDGGTQSPEAEPDAGFTVEEALTLDGSNLSEYSRNIAVYGVDAEGLREEVQTGKGNDTIILGLGEFHIQTGEGNNTIYLSQEFKDVPNADDQSKYYLDAGDIEGASLLTQRQKDSDTLIINGSAYVNLTVMADKNKTSGGEAKQAVFFQKGSDAANQKPLLVSGLENVW
ncbi:hypothetical protein [Dapis sp. BLCC M126]|uniref:hypothetical protein n=1 Tax=Dapis sp. BLCC M126 TaxID=3400189 RepID=UPI003CF5F8E9